MSRLCPLLSSPVLLSAVALTLLLAGCGGAASTSGDEAQAPAGDAAKTQETESQPSEGAKERQQAPDIEGTTLTGERVSLADFRGKPVFLKVWASW